MIDLYPSAQDGHHEDRSHHVFDVEPRRGWKNHHVPEDLRDDVGSSALKLCVAHHQMDDAHLIERDATLALNFGQGVKDGMGVGFSLPSLHSPSHF